MFAIEMLPAAFGDCLWVEYGERSAPRRMLIDGGILGTYDAIVRRAQTEIDKHGQCVFELLVVSHVDIDHIDGIVKLLVNLPPNIVFKEVWFNGWRHLFKRLGGPSGEKLTVMIEDLKLPWNEKFGGRNFAAVLPAAGAPAPLPLDDGMVLTLLSPTAQALEKLRPQYKAECEKAGLVEGSLPSGREALAKDRRLRRRLGATIPVRALAEEPFAEDTAAANGSSIAFLAEFDHKTCLFAADALSKTLLESLSQRLGREKVQVNAFKLPHHGSRANCTSALFKQVQARKYLISTNGKMFNHPDPQAIARLLVNKQADAELYFNYGHEESKYWDEADTERDWRYEAHFPKSNEGWLRVEL